MPVRCSTEIVAVIQDIESTHRDYLPGIGFELNRGRLDGRIGAVGDDSADPAGSLSAAEGRPTVLGASQRSKMTNSGRRPGWLPTQTRLVRRPLMPIETPQDSIFVSSHSELIEVHITNRKIVLNTPHL